MKRFVMKLHQPGRAHGIPGTERESIVCLSSESSLLGVRGLFLWSMVGIPHDVWIHWDLDWTWGSNRGGHLPRKDSCSPNAHRGPPALTYHPAVIDVRGMEQGIGLLHPFAL